MKRVVKMSTILVFILLIGISYVGCGGSSSSSGGDNVDPATGNTWDKMEWDKGTWG